jgi:hypothetical protein
MPIDSQWPMRLSVALFIVVQYLKRIRDDA